MRLPNELLVVVASYFDNASLLHLRLWCRRAHDCVFFCSHRDEFVDCFVLNIDFAKYSSGVDVRRLPSFLRKVKFCTYSGSHTNVVSDVVGSMTSLLKSIEIVDHSFPRRWEPWERLFELDFSHLERLCIVGERVDYFLSQCSAACCRTSPFASLSRLVLYNVELCETDMPEFVSLLSSGIFPLLTHLNLGGNAIGPSGAALLANARHLSSLTFLGLERCNIGDVGAMAIAHSTVLINLTHLNLGRAHIWLTNVFAIVGAISFFRLTHLNLNQSGIMDDYIVNTSAATAAQGLKLTNSLMHLELSSCYTLGSVGAQALISSFSSLTRLNFSYSNLGRVAAKTLAESSNSSKMTYLNLCCNGIGDEGVLFLVKSPHLCSLSHLNLRCNRMSKEASRVFAQHCPSNFPHLTYLDLSDNKIDLAAFAGSLCPFSRLSHLFMQNCLLTENAVHAMAKSTNFPALAQLDMRCNNLFGKQSICALFGQGSFALNQHFPCIACLLLNH